MPCRTTTDNAKAPQTTGILRTVCSICWRAKISSASGARMWISQYFTVHPQLVQATKQSHRRLGRVAAVPKASSTGE